MAKTISLTRQADAAKVEVPDPTQFSLFVATPCYGGQCLTHYLHGVMGLQEVCAKLGMGFRLQTLSNESLVQRARNTLVAEFLRSACTHLLFIDADIGFDPLDVMRLVCAQKPIVAGVYPKKNVNWPAVNAAAAIGQTDLARFAADYNLNLERGDGNTVTVSGELLRVKDAATGFMLIARDVFDQMRAALPEIAYISNSQGTAGQTHHAFFDCFVDESGTYLSEDWAFCRRWQKMGGEIWIDPRVKLTHVGTHPFTAEPIATWLDRQTAPQAAE